MRLVWVETLEEVDRQAWNALVEPGSPTLRWEWLHVLERNALRTGQAWGPTHALVWEGRDLVAAAPFYWRREGWGDFAFDQEIHALARSWGGSWYPRLTGVVPFTAAMGWRVLHPPGRQDAAGFLLRGAWDLVVRRGTGLACLWLDSAWVARKEILALFRELEGAFLERSHFWWERRGEVDFEDFLARLTKNDRHNARRELKSAAEHGLAVHILRAAEAPPSWHRAMARYYFHTNEQFGPWAAQYLDGHFFEEAAAEAGELVWYVAALASGDEVPEAMSFLVSDGVHWVGRYWGQRRFYRNLHFQLCYLEPFRYLLGSGGRSFDPGMGSPHKLRRGFWSAPAWFWFLPADPALAAVLREASGGRQPHAG